MKEDLWRFGIGILMLFCIIEPLDKGDLGLLVYIGWLEIFIISVYVSYIYGRDYFWKSPDKIIEENT